MTESSNRIHISELSWKPQKAEEAILNQICIDFKQGGFYGILGPNGSGKTSLIKHILRLIDVKNGELKLEGKQLNSYKRMELARKLALVPQNTNLETEFTAYDIVMMGRAPYLKRFQSATYKDQQIVEDAMRMTNSHQYKNQRFTNLSGGEAQRVITARAIAQQTPWLILDEPIAHLDIRYQIELMQNLRKLNQEKQISIMAVLHDINLAAEYCKQIILMNKGRIVAAGQTEEVLTTTRLKETYGLEFIEMKHPTKKCSYFIAGS